MNLNSLREDIDRIDSRILALLNERLEKALLTRSFKRSVEDRGREAIVLERVRRSARCAMAPEFAESLYRLIIDECRGIQSRATRLVGFQGDHGAYSEAAARAWDKDAAAIPCRDFSDVFEGVQEGYFDFGILPVENTLGGIVGPVNSILINTDLRIVAAVDMPIRHCLMALPGADHREIRSAYSHPQALAQCRRFLERNRLEAVHFYDTAGAARMVAEERPKAIAAIASSFAAELYGLEIIKEGVQDAENNRTRFFVVAREAAPEGGNKCSVVFFTEDKAGALFRALEIFATAGINLTRIESVPDKPGDYAMFIDFEGSDRDPAVADALASAARSTRDFRLLGCYTERRL